MCDSIENVMYIVLCNVPDLSLTDYLRLRRANTSIRTFLCNHNLKKNKSLVIHYDTYKTKRNLRVLDKGIDIHLTCSIGVNIGDNIRNILNIKSLRLFGNKSITDTDMISLVNCPAKGGLTSFGAYTCALNYPIFSACICAERSESAFGGAV